MFKKMYLLFCVFFTQIFRYFFESSCNLIGEFASF